MRVAIVNDMRMAAEALRRVVCSEVDHEVTWIAFDGSEAVAKCAEDVPDVVLMDLIMPVMDGVEATRRIMRESPCAILVVTATVKGNASKVFAAMGHGALDAVATPVMGPEGQIEGGAELLAKIATLGRLLGKDSSPKNSQRGKGALPVVSNAAFPLVAMGASTGGPAALARVLSLLPVDFGAAVVIVQHVDVQFAGSLADWLNAQSLVTVRVATEGCRPEVGTVLLAATNDHLTLTAGGFLRYTPIPRESAYRPSVDVFFQSAADHWKGKVVGVLLTGMGRDGAEGLLTLRRRGEHTHRQQEYRAGRPLPI